jgi:hypothetical protein
MSIVKAALLARATKIALGTAILSVVAALAPGMARAQLLSPQWPQEQRDRFLALGKAQWSLDQTCNTMITFTRTLETDPFFAKFNGVPARVEMASDFAAWKQDDARGRGARHPSSVFNWSICKGNQVAATIFALPPQAAIPAVATLPPAAPDYSAPVPVTPVSVGMAGTVQLGMHGGTYVIPDVILNNTSKANFTLDSGAADITMPTQVIYQMVAKGDLTPADFLGVQTYVIADGSKHIQPMYRLHSVTIGGVTLHDVQASGSDGDVWLLGQTFLRRLSSWSIDNKTATLHISA